jgi:hypothetical protein
MGPNMFPAYAIPVISRPQGIGKVFYVSSNGNNDNSGVDPSSPFHDITFALTQVVANRNDYIIVLLSWQDEPAWPIQLGAAHNRVHILGFTNASSRPQCYMVPDTDNPVFDCSQCWNFEIAGFNLSGGSNHGCIESGTSINGWIHHCWFGNQDQLSGQTPLHGFLQTTGDHQGLCIEDCLFLGDQCNAGGGITGNGIELVAAANSPSENMYRRNIFHGLAIGINGLAIRRSYILDNKFACQDQVGGAITLGADSQGNFIDGNHAGEGDVALASNPFSDANVGAANNWGVNQCTLVAGAAAMNNLPA